MSQFESRRPPPEPEIDKLKASKIWQVARYNIATYPRVKKLTEDPKIDFINAFFVIVLFYATQTFILGVGVPLDYSLIRLLHHMTLEVIRFQSRTDLVEKKMILNKSEFIVFQNFLDMLESLVDTTELWQRIFASNYYPQDTGILWTPKADRFPVFFLKNKPSMKFLEPIQIQYEYTSTPKNFLEYHHSIYKQSRRINYLIDPPSDYYSLNNFYRLLVDLMNDTDRRIEDLLPSAMTLSFLKYINAVCLMIIDQHLTSLETDRPLLTMQEAFVVYSFINYILLLQNDFEKRYDSEGENLIELSPFMSDIDFNSPMFDTKKEEEKDPDID